MEKFESEPENNQIRPENETYEYAEVLNFLQELERNPNRLERFNRAANARANDIFENGKLIQEIEPTDRVLYIGAGTGHMPEKIRKETGASITMIDLVDLRTSDMKSGNNMFVRANARHLPFAPETFDVVCAFDMLHHTKNQTEILNEFARCKKPQGKILLLENVLPEKSSKTRRVVEKLYALMDDNFNRQPRGVNPHNFHSIAEWGEMIKDLRLKIARMHEWTWGLPEFLPLASHGKRKDRSLLRPFKDALMVIGNITSET